MDPNDIISLLEKLAQQLTPAANHVWELAVKQTFIEGILAIVYCVIIIAVWITWGLIGKKLGASYLKSKANGESFPDTELWFIFWAIIGGILVAGGILLFVVNINIAISDLLNPEWQTIVKLSHLVISSSK